MTRFSFLFVLCSPLLLFALTSCHEQIAKPDEFNPQFFPTSGAIGDSITLELFGGRFDPDSVRLLFTPSIVSYPVYASYSGDTTRIIYLVPEEAETGPISYTVKQTVWKPLGEFVLKPGLFTPFTVVPEVGAPGDTVKLEFESLPLLDLSSLQVRFGDIAQTPFTLPRDLSGLYAIVPEGDFKGFVELEAGAWERARSRNIFRSAWFFSKWLTIEIDYDLLGDYELESGEIITDSWSRDYTIESKNIRAINKGESYQIIGYVEETPKSWQRVVLNIATDSSIIRSGTISSEFLVNPSLTAVHHDSIHFHELPLIYNNASGSMGITRDLNYEKLLHAEYVQKDFVSGSWKNLVRLLQLKWESGYQKGHVFVTLRRGK
ncbi:MAG: hypothetical protein AB7H80_07785 [Candidatus Kapaibacterium sp.]